MAFTLHGGKGQSSTDARGNKPQRTGQAQPSETIIVPLVKQVCKLSREVATLRAMVLTLWKLKKEMSWIGPIQEAHSAFVQEQDRTSSEERWRMDPIQVRLMQALVPKMSECLKTVQGPEAEEATPMATALDQYLGNIQTEGARKVGAEELFRLKLSAAYKPHLIQLEAMIIPNTASYRVWYAIVVKLFTNQGGYKQQGIAPTGDLERKL